MQRIKILAAIVTVAAMITWGLSITLVPSCSTIPISKDTLCKDAQMGYSLSLAMLDTALTAEGNVYWLAYKVGAGMAIQTYCGGFASPAVAVK